MTRAFAASLLLASLACAAQPRRLDPAIPISPEPGTIQPPTVYCEGLARRCPQGYRCIGNVCDPTPETPPAK